MKTTHLITSLAIVACTAICWFILGGALSQRTSNSIERMSDEVSDVWGPQITQLHPRAWYDTPNAPEGRATILPTASDLEIQLEYDPKKRGLFWHRTYDATFTADYRFTNPTRIPQTFYIEFPLPQDTAGLKDFQCRLGETNPSVSVIPNSSGTVLQTVLLGAGESINLRTHYKTRGTDTWRYTFQDNRRIAGFNLKMRTDFEEINFPTGTSSPVSRDSGDGSFTAVWNYTDILSAPSIGMDMPKQLNAGPVASRIAFFAPVSLLFFVTILLLGAGLLKIPLHPMHIFFVSAGFFAFHLLFAYLVDLIPLWLSFLLATLTSLLLVCGYLRALGGMTLFKIALPSQLLYLVLFSASFFIDGLTGITLTVLGVLTLAVLMRLTARTAWHELLGEKKAAAVPPALPRNA
ncbi:MAG TPA: hypothetical protein VFY13_07790 [Luteolibacter sp.]|nr:hypothetical protein [Luteolibacter sp.]